jgi:Asp-tRNA(Asn)/Glu-tRNA(Gln) amidotransferase A subunit family amidase
MAAVFRDGLARLRAGGAAIQTLDLAATLVGLRDAQRTVMFYEGARFHEQRYAEHGDRLAHMAGLVREGLRIPAAAYDQALAYIAARRRDLVTAYQTTPVILVPAATGPAPAGLESTGDSSMNAPWTALGTPAITIPLPVTSGLPLGLQLTAAPGRGATVLQTAVALERLRGSRR